MRTIEIDLDVHKKIEEARLSFGETDNDILRRLVLGGAEARSPAHGGKGAWMSQGVTLPHGTEAIAEYNGQRIAAKIVDGRWIVDGKTYNGPSPALQENVTTRSGKKTNLNGWVYWRVRAPGEADWKPLSSMRLTSLTLADLDI